MVQGIGGAGAVAMGVAGLRRSGGRFVIEEGPMRARGPVATMALAGLGGLLAVQEAEFSAVRDRAARMRARRMVEGLGRLQRALLGGQVDAAALQELATLAAGPLDAADPELRATLTAVAVRARVELARLRVAGMQC